MTIFYLNLVLVYACALYARFISKPVTIQNMGGLRTVHPSKLPALFALASLVVVAGLRINIGDTIYYIHSYAMNTYTWEGMKGQKDIGFNVFQMLLQTISHDPQIMVFAVALITNLLIVLVLYKYSRLFELSLYVYITSGMYLTSMNGIRQFLAAAIVFAATKYIFEGNWKKYVLVILLASQIHLTAIILIPIYFIVRKPAWSRTTFLLLLLATIIVIGFNQFSTALFTVIENSQYGDYKNVNYQGANFLRVLVDGMPVLFAFLGRDKLRELFPKSDYIVNMSILGVVFMIIATQNWIFARFAIYFGLYSLILIAWVIKVFAVKLQKLIYFGILISYFIFFFYEHVISLGITYRSNILVW